MAWVHQLSAGFSSPGGVYAGEPNSYPWLFHSLVALIAAALPGGTVDAFQVLELFGLVCAGVGCGCSRVSWVRATRRPRGVSGCF